MQHEEKFSIIPKLGLNTWIKTAVEIINDVLSVPHILYDMT